MSVEEAKKVLDAFIHSHGFGGYASQKAAAALSTLTSRITELEAEHEERDPSQIAGRDDV